MSAAISTASTLKLMVRREFWEHRAFLFAPAIVAAIMVVGAIFGTNELHVGDTPDPDWMQHSDKIVAVALSGLATPFVIVMCIVTIFYLLDSLYADRKDRSVLFWKSLPVSDVTTVSTKLLTATVVVPLLTFGVVIVTNLVVAFILSVRLSGAEALDVWNTVWQADIWFPVHGLMLYGLFVAILWYLPIIAWLLLASAYARRAVILWAALPPILAMIVEEIVFDTSYVAQLLRHRLVGWTQFGAHGDGERIQIDGESMDWPRSVGEFIDFGAFLASPGLWGGLIVAALLLYGTILIRRRSNTI